MAPPDEGTLWHSKRILEGRLQALADRAPAAMFVMDRGGRYVFVNEHMAFLLGGRREAVLGRTNEELLGPERAAQLAPIHARVLAGEVVSTEDVVSRLDPPRHYATVKFPLDEEGERAIGCVAMEITERKRAEDRARHAAELLELGDAFFEMDREWRIVRVNRNQERLSRKPRETTLGRTFFEVWPELCGDPPSRYLLEYRRAMEERVPREFDDYYAPLDLWTAVTAYPVSGGGLAVFFRDITKRKHAEREREQAREFERQLLGIVSHDLRSPLSAISLAAHTLLRRGGLDERQAAAVARIVSSGERATRLIHDLLDFAQVRMGGTIELRCRRTALAGCVSAALEEARAAFPGRAVEADLEPDAAGDWDADRLVQVAGNLVTNALKYSPPGAAVRVRVETRGELALLSVHNDGSHIPPAAQARIFEPLERGAAAEGPFRSAGLGLFIVRTLVEAHRGRVWVESSPEHGTTFTVELPREGACAEQPAATG